MKNSILIIDNYDSFVYNIYQYVAIFAKKIKVFRNDEITVQKILRERPCCIILSPGPKRPINSGVCLEIIKKLYSTTPILGICLGHQAIASCFGAKIIHAPTVKHGKTSRIVIEKKSCLHHSMPKKINVMRYHSLIVEEATLSKDFRITSKTEEDDIIMSIEHQKYPLFGVQYHPESILAEKGKMHFQNFLHIVKAFSKQQ